MTSASASPEAWAAVLARVIDDSHLVTGDGISSMADAAVRDLGLGVQVLVADLAQRVLVPIEVGSPDRLDVTGTLAGRAYQHAEILAGTDDDGEPLLWVPLLDGTDRVGVLRVRLGAGRRATGPDVADSPALRHWLATLAGLLGHIVMTKLPYSDRLRRWRSDGPLSAASELLWQLLPPRTFATERAVVSALLEPHDCVAGDAYDYNVEGDVIDLAVFDAAGHDLRASMTTALAITGVRNARRAGDENLAGIAARADDLISEQPGPLQFATAVLARLDTASGLLHYVLAGHPPPLLVRQGRVVKELAAPPRPPLGVRATGAPPVVVAQEQLEPGDRLLLYSDGITEARDERGRFFGEQRLVEFTEHAAAAQLTAPETLRRLAIAVLDHQGGRLQDDATLLLVDWSSDGHLRLLPRTGPDLPAGL